MVSKDGGKHVRAASANRCMATCRLSGSTRPIRARMWQGSDGGLASSWDAGQTWEHIASISLGQFYHVYADVRRAVLPCLRWHPGQRHLDRPSRTREPSGILNDDWRMVSPIVGFNVLSDAEDPDILLTQTPGGTLLRTDLRTRDQQTVGPQVRNYGGATRRGNEVPLRLGRAPGAVSALRKIDLLLRRQRDLPIQRSRAELGADQPRPDHRERLENAAVRRAGLHRQQLVRDLRDVTPTRGIAGSSAASCGPAPTTAMCR